METNHYTMKPGTKFLHWTPRILGILAILFISMFTLDAFDPNKTFWQQFADFMMHMIPSFALIAFLVIAWKWELAGGIIFILIGLGFSPIIYMHNYQMNDSVWMSLKVLLFITFPFILVGILFVLSHYKKKREL